MVPFIDAALIISQAEPYFLWLIFFFDLELLTSIRTVKFCFAVLFKIKPEERRRVRGWPQARFFSVIVYSDDLPLKPWLHFKSGFQVAEAALGGTKRGVTQCRKMMVLWPFLCFFVVVLSAALSERAAFISKFFSVWMSTADQRFQTGMALFSKERSDQTFYGPEPEQRKGFPTDLSHRGRINCIKMQFLSNIDHATY